MGNPLKDTFEKNKIQQEIFERQQIIIQYEKTGNFTLQKRNEVIRKIVELRKTDEKIAAVYMSKPMGGPLACCPDSELINQLKQQIVVLNVELEDMSTNVQS